MDDNNDNPIIIPPHIVLTDEEINDNPINHTIWLYYVCIYCCFRSSVNTLYRRIMIGLSLLSSLSKHTMWSYYDWAYCCCRPSVNTICGRIMKRTKTTINTIIIQPYCMFTDRRQQRQPNHNTTTYCIY
jgi:hypothetical protein